MKELISIIVPVYKVEKYLKECIESIQRQTYKDIEIILVDDGSPDKCGEICDEYAKRDNRIKVIHKENGGLSDARNAGIQVAIGKYIAFIDSDDYIEETYIELLYNAIIENRVSISQCGINKVNEKSQFIKNVGEKEEKVYTSQQMMEELYNGKWENIVTWNKLYLKSLFSDIKFPKGKIHEDEFTTYKLIFKAENLVIIDKFLYNYRQNTNSITGSKYNIKRLDIIEAFQERMEFLERIGEIDLYNRTLIITLDLIRKNYVKVKKYIHNSHKLQKELLKKYKIIYIKAKKIDNVQLNEKIKNEIFYKFPSLWFLLKNMSNKGI